MYKQFDPKKHKGLQLYELQTNEVDGTLEFVYVPVEVSWEDAIKTPWYYLVKI